MCKIMYYCKECGSMYAFEDKGCILTEYHCEKCGGYLYRTGKRKVPPLTESEYNTMIINNKWDDFALQNYCLLYFNNPERIKSEILQLSQDHSQPIPKCPTCGSTNIRRISATEKAVNIGMFGLFGNKRKYQFECLNPNCKYKW